MTGLRIRDKITPIKAKGLWMELAAREGITRPYIARVVRWRSSPRRH